MPFDFKKEYKDLYQPKALPSIVTVPAAGFLAVDGEGDPNEEEGAYQQAVSQLYAVAYALKMSDRAGYVMEGFFPYVVPPLEGFWRQGEMDGTVDYSRKADFRWTSVLRLPDFVTAADVAWAVDRRKEEKAGLLRRKAPHHRRGPLCPNAAPGALRQRAADHRGNGGLCGRAWISSRLFH